MKDSISLTFITLLLAVCSLSAATRYVSLESTNPTPPYTTWASAATNIQDAVDAAVAGDRILVSNGVYSVGGRGWAEDSLNRVMVNKPVALLSVNGPQFTSIRGDKVIYPPPPGGHDAQVIGPRCVYLADGASMSGFTLTNGMGYVGGGVLCSSTNSVVTNCVIVGNSAPGWTADGWGGGANGGTLYNCKLTGNYAAFAGGGAAYSTLYNCTVTGNRGGYYSTAVGGVYSCTLYNCILYYNTAGMFNFVVNYDPSCTMNYCCTVPQPANGNGNITYDPAFIDYTNGNLRLQSNSPCINAGNNAYVTTATDLDGNPRIVGGTVDIGAYEYQRAGSPIFYAWLQQYGLPTDGSADYADPDHDAMNNWQEWVCGTCPTNAQSVLRMVSALPNTTNARVTWQSVAGVNYFLQRSANLTSPFIVVATNIIGQVGTTTYADTNATGAGLFFYRVGVLAP